MKTIRWIVTLAMAASVAGMAACGDAKEDPATAADTATSGPAGAGIPASLTTVTISDNKFSPVSLQVPVGATVTWKWTGSARHSVKGNFGGQDISSPTLGGTGTYLFAFQQPGTFEYECGVHGAAMKGTITIK